MINIVGTGLNQWDTGRKVKVTDSEATHVHFANPGDSKAVIMELIGGETKIPDYLLRTGKALNAYAVLDGVTLESRAFAVRKRERPEDYIYEDDQRNYIYKLIDKVNEAIDNANKAVDELGDLVKTVNGIAPDENGNVEIETGGASALTVTYEGDQASHTSDQIRSHVESGGCVYLAVEGILYISLVDVDYGQALFIDSQGTEYSIDAEGRISTYQNTNNESMMLVHVPNGEQADHFPSQMLAHLEAGGVVMLEVDGVIVNLSYCNEEYATFAEMNNDFVHYVHFIDEYGNYARTEMPHASENVVDDKIGDISTALDRIIELQEELIGV